MLNFFKLVFLIPIEIYQKFISPFLPKRCRYHPSCSEYAKESIKKFGIFKGLLAAALRILRCSPLFEGGDDYVLEKFNLKELIAKYKGNKK